MLNLLRQDVTYLKGIGPQRAQLLAKELEIKTVYDLLHHFPSHYLDRSQVYQIATFAGEMPYVQVRGRFVSFAEQGEGAKRRLVALFSDGSAVMEVVWFNRIRQIKEMYHTGNEYVVFGKPSLFSGRWSMVHPEIDVTTSAGAMQGLRGVYPLTEKLRTRGITSRTIFQWVQTALASIRTLNDPIPAEILGRLRLMDALTALRTIHNPADNESLQRARLRLKFEELFLLQLNIRRYAVSTHKLRGITFERVGHFFNSFYFNQLPFELTNAQKRVIKEIRADMGSGRQMNRLLQGDVGSGKTLVALLCMLIALDNGYQSCLMAPTEILATQHYETLSKLLAPIGINVKLLTGSTRKKQRDIIDQQLADGSLHILVGTHAIIEDRVQFRRLGFAVIDEQHRFGVVQRSRLWTKNAEAPPHVLVMTATPIPRTLAMTVYGDLDVSVIDELPPGRKPIVTLLRYENNREDVYRGIGRQLREGRQAYIVYPLVKESEKLDLKSVEEGYERIRETFPSYIVAFVHGQLKPAAKDYQMGMFASGEARILVATTVIEVGVNVPNATIMVIENSERFGLSQLHQLRGRVGRGEGQSYCILMSKHEITRETRQRLQLMTSTTDGFEIAEADLKMRGPGDLEGTMQSGIAFNLHIANLAQDGQIVQLARNAADDLLAIDPDISRPEHLALRRLVDTIYSRNIDFSLIS